MEQLYEDGVYEEADYTPPLPMSALGMGLTGSHRTGKTTLMTSLA